MTTRTGQIASQATQQHSNDPSKGEALAVMQRFYAAEVEYVTAGPGKGSFDELAACLDPEVVLYQAPGLPYTGVWQGRDGIQRFLDVFSQVWRSLDVLEARPLVDGDTVVMLLRARFHARATGRVLETRMVQVNTVKNGRITEFRPFYWDPPAVAEATAHQQSAGTRSCVGGRQGNNK